MYVHLFVFFTDSALSSLFAFVMQIMMTFDVVTNWRKLMLSSVDTRLACLNGLRAISMFWIIYGHTLFNALQAGFVNEIYMLPGGGPNAYTETYAFLMVCLTF